MDVADNHLQGDPVIVKLLVVLLIVFGYLLVARVVRGVPARRRRRH
jgi:hypothetical protein